MNGRHLIQSNSFVIPLAANSVNMVATSWPYFGLRSYDGKPVMVGGVVGCDHQWVGNQKKRISGGEREYGSYDGGVGRGPAVKLSESAACGRCGAWRGCFGNENLHDCLAWARNEPPCWYCYVCHGRALAAETWRVLHPTGTFWLNLGDSYAQDSKWGGRSGGKNYTSKEGGISRERKSTGLKDKDLIGIPWRVALALQADGWFLRRDIVWAKGVSFCADYSGSSMPESVTDRPSTSHEYVFLLAKSERYFFDMEAVRERGGDGSDRWGGAVMTLDTEKAFGGNAVVGSPANRPLRTFEYNGKRNPRSVWVINPQSYKGAHYACWPPSLVEPMIKAGSSEFGICPECRSPWKRITKKGKPEQRSDNANPVLPYTADSGYKNGLGATTLHMVREVETVGWQPTCKCPEHTPVPAVILDPFSGSGTTVMVARQLGRVGIGLDLSFAYLAEQAKERTGIAAEERFVNGVVDENDYSDLFTIKAGI